MGKIALVDLLVQSGVAITRAREFQRWIDRELPCGWGSDDVADVICRSRKAACLDLANDPDCDRICEHLRDGQKLFAFKAASV